MNRVENQKIHERPAPPVRAQWSELADRHPPPRGNLPTILVPLFGFILAAMLILSFAAALQGAPARLLNGGRAHQIARPRQMAVFVL
jgi:hypothetical protein